MGHKWSLTGCDGPDFASASRACLVDCGDVAVIVGGWLQVLHHSHGGGEGEVNQFSCGLRVHLQNVGLCRWHCAPFYCDGSARLRRTL